MTTTVKLKYPIEHEGATYAELKLRRVLAGDLEAIERQLGGEAAQKQAQSSMIMLSRLTGIPIEAVRKIDMADFTEVSEVMNGFLEPTGQMVPGSAN